MKKLALVITPLFLLLVTFKVSLAQTETSSPFQIRKDRVETRREAVKERVGERKENIAERRENLQERRKANLSRFLQKMVARLRAMVVRLETLISRIEARLEKIAESNPDENLSSIQAEVERAKTLLSSTKDKIADIEGMEDELATSEAPKEVFESIRAKLTEIKTDLKSVHSILVHVIGQIKGLRVGDTKNETQ